MGQVLLRQSLSPAEINSESSCRRFCFLSGIISSCFPACFWLLLPVMQLYWFAILNDFILRRSDFLLPPKQLWFPTMENLSRLLRSQWCVVVWLNFMKHPLVLLTQSPPDTYTLICLCNLNNHVGFLQFWDWIFISIHRKGIGLVTLFLQRWCCCKLGL